MGDIASSPNSLAILVQVDRFILAKGMRYVLFGVELRDLISRLCKEALHYSVEAPVGCPPFWAEVELDERQARVWVVIEGSPDGHLELSVWNKSKVPVSREEFKEIKINMIPVHRQIGTCLERDSSDEPESPWFHTRIKFHWITGGTN